MVSVANVLVVHPSQPMKTLADYIAAAKAKPGQVNYGSAGVGSNLHLAMELLKVRTGIEVTHVPYKGAGPGLQDTLAGHVMSMMSNVPSAKPHIDAGKLRALAVTSITRSGLLPDVPTMIEAGLSGFDASLYYGLVAPAGTPRSIVDKLNKALRDALASDEVKKQLGNDGTEITPGTPEDYADFIDKDEKKWSQLVKASGVEQE
jgi:tripartite-type tricarboxylate transporter receptor subunit TctC